MEIEKNKFGEMLKYFKHFSILLVKNKEKT